MPSREFDLGDVVSITANALVSSRGMAGLKDLLEYLVDRPDLPKQMFPMAMRLSRPWILQRHGQLADLEVPDWVNSHAYANRWVMQQKTRLGYTTLHIDPLPPELWERAEAKFFAEYRGRIIYENGN